jgi:hypothetical protein
MTTRAEKIREEVTAIRIEVRMVELRRLALESAAAYEFADAALRRELRELIDNEPDGTQAYPSQSRRKQA